MLYLTVRNLVGVRVFRFAEVTAAIADLTPTLRKGFAGALCKQINKCWGMLFQLWLANKVRRFVL